MTISVLPDYRTKTEIILESLRARIVSGELAPGRRLVLRAIADEFACSDIPVREAMRSLASEGLVAIVPHEGARVTEFDASSLVELTETRALLEPSATVAAGARVPASAIALLKELLTAMSEVAAGPSLGEYGRLNREFHRIILSYCPNRTLVRTIEDLWDKAARGRAVHLMLRGHIKESIEHHQEIVRCIEERDLRGLRAIAEAHAEHGLSAVRRLAEDEPATDNARRELPA